MTDADATLPTESGRPERESVPEYLRGTEQPFLGLLLLLAPLAHGVRAVVWTASPPEQGGRGLAAASAVCAVLLAGLWRYFSTNAPGRGYPAWAVGVAVGLAAGSVQALVAVSGVSPLLAVPMAFAMVLRDHTARMLASAIALAMPLLFLDLSDPEVVLLAGTAVAVVVAGSGIVRRRRTAQQLRIDMRSRLADLIASADAWRSRQTTMVAGLAHDVRGPLNGAAMALQIADTRFGGDLDPTLAEAARSVDRGCFELSGRLTEMIRDLRSRAETPVVSEPEERETILRQWHMTEQVDLPIFALTVFGLLLVGSALRPDIWEQGGLLGFGGLMALVAFYGALSIGSRGLGPQLGTDAGTWLILAPALLWVGMRAVELQTWNDLALTLSFFWVGAVSSRSARAVVVAGLVVVALKLAASPVVDQALIVVGIAVVAYAYRRAGNRLAQEAADWTVRIDRRHAAVQRDTIEFNLLVAERISELRTAAHRLLSEMGAVRDRAKVEAPQGALELFDRAYDALSGLQALVPEGSAEEVDRTRVVGVTDWVTNVFVDRVTDKKCTLAVEVADDLEVALPEGALKKILINLVDNAVKFSPESGQVSLRARPGPSEDRVVFTVSDQGPGMAESEVGRLFAWFEQGDSARSSAESGFGIGLGVVGDLVRAADGRIDVESEPGSTSIRVSLPA